MGQDVLVKQDSDTPRGSMTLPDGLVEPAVRAILWTLQPDGQHLTPAQSHVLEALCRRTFNRAMDISNLSQLDPRGAATEIRGRRPRLHVVQLAVALEMFLHPIPKAISQRVETLAFALDVAEPMVTVGREMAENHLSRMYLDIQRNSWYLRETIEQSGQGRLAELARSKLAYAGIVGDSAIAHKWRSLGDNPDGSWGKAVHQFYVDHSFPFPGEKHGIYELGALHDWVHVLAGYGTEPEGEIDVFAFIAAGMEDPHGFTQFVMTLGLFQNYSIKHVSGKRILTARSDTVDDRATSERLADALRRGSQTTVDTMGGIDHFSLAAENLDELRMRFNIAPKSDVS